MDRNPDIYKERGLAEEVALLTECVDRNRYLAIRVEKLAGRTPYGVRG